MKFVVQVTGEAALGLEEQDFSLEASDGDAAVEAVRARLAAQAPLEGGELTVTISTTSPWERVTRTPRGGELRETVPPGEVTTFGHRFEPHESVRAEVEEKRAKAEAEKAELEKRAALKEELRAELAAEQAAAGKVVPK